MELFDVFFWKDFVSNLGATIIGVALGIPAALWNNIVVENQTTKEKVEKVIWLLKDELSKRSIKVGIFSI
jgi:hypothetical protein